MIIINGSSVIISNSVRLLWNSSHSGCRPSVVVTTTSRFFHTTRSSKIFIASSTTDAAAASSSISQQQQHLENERDNEKRRKRRLDVAIAGLPNAGKSQLLNVLTKSPVSAVSRKRHTTRQEVMGARTIKNNDANTQLLFLDTPGFLKRSHGGGSTKEKDAVDRDLQLASAAIEMERIDHTLLVIDAAKNLTTNVRKTIVELMLLALESKGRIEEDCEEGEEDVGDVIINDDDDDENDDNSRRKFSVVLNKVDLVRPKTDLLDLAEEIGTMAEECLTYRDGGGGSSSSDQTILSDGEDRLGIAEHQHQLLERMPMFFYISALKEDGTDDLLQYLVDMATPCRSWEVEEGQATLQTPQQRVEEIIREKLYRCLHKEIPYQVRQNNKLFERKVDRRTGESGLLIHQELVVRTKSHRDLVRGSGGGRNLERIRETAERDLQQIFGCKVVLQLFIKLLKSKQSKRGGGGGGGGGNWSI